MDTPQDDSGRQEEIRALSHRASSLESAVMNTRMPSELEQLIHELKALHMNALAVPGAGTVSSGVSSLLMLAERRYIQATLEEDKMIEVIGAEGTAFCCGMYQFMTTKEKQFFDSLVPGQEYEMMRIDEHGNIVSTGRTVDGAQLREDFSRIKYHALNEEEQRQAPSPPGAKTPEEEMDRLQESLENMEGHEAQKMHERGASPEEARQCRDRYRCAHEQVDRVRERHRSVREAREAGADEHVIATESARLQVEEEKLRDTLQNDIINPLVGQTPEEVTKEKKQGQEQGIEVTATDSLPKPLPDTAETAKRPQRSVPAASLNPLIK